MKRMILAVAAAMLIGTAAMAQDTKQPDEAMLQKRTEFVAKKYGLDEEQTQKLAELNKKYADVLSPPFGRRPPRRGGRPMAGARQDSTAKIQLAPGDGPNENQRHRPADMRERFAERRAKLEAYQKELQGIMTEEQFNKYKADMSQRAPRRK